MGETSAIEWTDATWNPVTGCTKVSPGCDHCYAESIAERWRGGTAFPNGFDVQLREHRLLEPLKWRQPKRVFVNSMSDLFHDAIPSDYIAQAFAVMAAAGQHTFQVLTKRHARMRSLMNSEDFWRDVNHHYVLLPSDVPSIRGYQRPLPNVWLGVSVEDQHWADIRIPALIDTPAVVRFLSCEPLLGPVDLSAWVPPGFARWRCSGCRRFYSGAARDICPGCGRFGYWSGSHTGNGRPGGQPLGWVIVGGESGHGHRPMDPEWVRTLRDQCAAGDVPFFFKQWGGRTPKAGGRDLDGQTWDLYPSRGYRAGVA